jgi:hypothetical protein
MHVANKRGLRNECALRREVTASESSTSKKLRSRAFTSSARMLRSTDWGVLDVSQREIGMGAIGLLTDFTSRSE